MNSTLSREQIRLQKAKERKLRNDARIAREKAWLASHPEIALAKEQEKRVEAEKRHALWLENEEKRKQLSVQVKKKKPSNAFSALISDDSTDEETSDNDKTQELAPPHLISDGESTDNEAEVAEVKVSARDEVIAKHAPMNNIAKKSWADIMDESDDE